VPEENPREEKGISNRRIHTIFIPPLTTKASTKNKAEIGSGRNIFFHYFLP